MVQWNLLLLLLLEWHSSGSILINRPVQGGCGCRITYEHVEGQLNPEAHH
jgi:hypothetical protein